MATTTTRLGLRKPAGSDTVSVTTDLDNNFDTLDAAVSTTYATTNTRPSVPFQGQAVYESDSGLLVVSNGSVPASGSWSYPKAVVNRVTQTTRPATVANGATILETDSGALVVSNGSAPASGSWSYPRAVAGNVTSSTRPSVVTAGLQIRESDTHNMLVSNGSSPASGSWEHDSVPVVSSTASIVAPYTGQIIYNTADDLLYKYIGGVWVAFDATGTTSHELRYEQTTTQSIPNSADTKVQFNASVTTTPDVTVSGTGNTDFLLVRAGLWHAAACLRYNVGTTGERHIFMSTGTVLGTLANRFVGQSDAAAGAGQGNLSVSTYIRVAANTSVFVGAFQTNGGALGTDVGFGHMNHIALTWLRP